MTLFQRKNKPAEESQQFDNYVENLVSDSDPDIDLEIESSFSAATPHYRIEDAIELMRRLPEDNSDMVVTVVRETLQSANIDVEKIITNADTRSSEIGKNINSLTVEIETLQNQISEKKTAVEDEQKNLAETRQVKELLQRSQKRVDSAQVSTLESKDEKERKKQEKVTEIDDANEIDSLDKITVSNM